LQEILKGIFTWGGAYADMPWDLNGFAIRLDDGAILIDPPIPGADDWPQLDALKPIRKIIVTNRDHDREAAQFHERYHAPVVAGANEAGGFATLMIDETVKEGDILPGGLTVIDLPGKSPGEIGLYFDPLRSKLFKECGGIVILGDALVGHPAGLLRFVPSRKLDDAPQLRTSLRKLLALQFEVLLLCDGHSLLKDAHKKVERFLATQP
jgi:glyoxylase-like metal-dependent hydrolase (beta-lactamase superfamily II)